MVNGLDRDRGVVVPRPLRSDLTIGAGYMFT
jgi:hypothetical protein